MTIDAGPVPPRPRLFGREGAVRAAYAVGYVLAAVVAVRLGLAPEPGPAVALDAGVAAAAVVRPRTWSPRWTVPVVIAGTAVAHVVSGDSAAVGAAFGVGNAVTAQAMAGFASRGGLTFPAPRLRPVRVVQLFRCAVVSAVLGQAVGLVLAEAARTSGGHGWPGMDAAFAATFAARCGASLAGVLSVAPVLLVGARLRGVPRRRWVDLLGWLAALLMTTWLGLNQAGDISGMLPYVPLSVLLFAVVHRDLLAATTLMPLLALAALVGTARGETPFATTEPSIAAALSVQLYVVIAAVSALLLAVLVAERAEVTVELHKGQQRLADQVASARRALAQLEDLTAAVSDARDLARLLDVLLERLVRAVGADAARILLLDPATGLLRGASAVGLDDHVLEQPDVPLGNGYAGRIAGEGRPRVLDDLEADPDGSPALRHAGIRSAAGVPLLAGGEAVGVLYVASRTPCAFSAPDRDPVPALERIAERVAAAVVRARLADEVAAAAGRGEERVRAALDHLLDPVVVARPVRGPDQCPRDFLIVHVNAAAAVWGTAPGTPVTARFDRMSATHLLPLYLAVFEQGDPLVLDGLPLRNRDATGETRYVDLRVVRVDDELLISWRDITDRVSTARALAEHQARFQMAFDEGPVGMAVSSLEPGRVGTCLMANRALSELTGHHQDTLVGMRLQDMTHPDDTAVDDAQLVAGEAVDSPSRHQRELRMVRADGSVIWVRRTVAAARVDRETRCVVVHLEDVTERHAAEAELAHRALYDALTGLANRTLLLDHLHQALRELDRETGAVAVLYLDLDHFKDVNDTFGHEAGDAVLVEVAARVTACLRGRDTASRLAGDEFVVAARVNDDVHAARIAERLFAALSRPMDVLGRRLEVRPSIGVTVATAPGPSPEDLLRQADLAMYEAKRHGARPWEMYDDQLHHRAVERLEVEERLRRAVAQGWLRLLYQPIIDLRSGRVVSAEALLRIEDHEHGLLAPDAFIEIAEDSDLIVPIGGWVLLEACAQLARWQRDRPQMQVSVNVSARQVRQLVVCEQALGAAGAAGVSPSDLVLEMTERVLIDSTPPVLADLRAVTSAGCGLAIDDFGTGYSSMTYLKRFPVTSVKIDRSFVDGLGSREEDTAIVAAVTGLARTLDLTAVAEGVESGSQLSALLELGCPRAQGYHLGRPMSAESLTSLLRLGTVADRVG